jgi:hypothetical protein
MAKKKIKKPNKPYDFEGVKPKKWVADKFVLGMDPGSRNFGISLVGIHKGKIKVFANSVLMHPVDTLVEFGQAKEKFLAEIATWMALVPVNGMVAERFQTRGNGGPLIEQVSVMLGLLAGTYPQIPIKLTIASAWKNKFNKRFDCDLKEIYPEVAVQPHQLDATLIGVFGLEAGLNTNLEYTPDDIIEQVEATSLLEHRRMK